ncbi:MAG: DUF2760 domain-containing protein [Pirellulales bacterium]|nr:DUF2760 domain-containing protein [Pirellulales bacterium]
MRLWTAIRAFFRALLDGEFARRAERLLAGGATGPPVESAKPAPAVPKPPGQRRASEAIVFLAALQREARFVDFVQESLEGYGDAQIGAAARDVHRHCAKVIDRMFALTPLVAEAEGASVEIPTGFDPGCYRLTGQVSGEPPLRGTVVHHGWKATRCELPTWSGTPAAADVVAPAEVEIVPSPLPPGEG